MGTEKSYINNALSNDRTKLKRQRTENRAKNPVDGKEKPKPISLSHPSLATYHKLQDTLKEAGLYEELD